MQQAGIDMSRAKAAQNSAAVKEEIATNIELQRALQLTGTPSWVVGDTVLNGAVGYDQLKAAIAAARAVLTRAYCLPLSSIKGPIAFELWSPIP